MQTSNRFYYELLGTSLVKMFEIRGLCVVFDRTLSFVHYVDFIIAKAYSMVGFMMRNYDVHINRIESVQKKGF